MSKVERSRYKWREIGNSNLIVGLVLFFFLSFHFLILVFAQGTIALAPDERNYVETFKDIFDGGKFEVRSGYPEASILVVRILLFPALVMCQMGIDPNLAMRLNSILYVSFGFMLILSKLFSSRKVDKVWVFVILVSFSPAMMVFTSLALRESLIYCLLICLFLLIEAILVRRRKHLYFFILTLVCHALFTLKFYVYLIVTFAMLIVFSKNLFLNNRSKVKEQIIISTAFFLGMLLSPQTLVHAWESMEYLRGRIFYSTDANQGRADSSVSTEAVDSDSKENAVNDDVGVTASVILSEKTENTTLKNLLTEPNPFTKILEKFSFGEPRGGLLNRPALDKPVSVVYGVFTFLLAPFPFFKYESFSLQLATLDSLFLIPLFVLFIFCLRDKFKEFRASKDKFGMEIGLLSAAFFISASVFTEDYIGILVRHRGVLLILLVTILITSDHVSSRKEH